MKIFSKLYLQFQRKLGNKSHNLTYCSMLQPVVVYNFSEIESTFSVQFRDYVANCWWLRHTSHGFHSLDRERWVWLIPPGVGMTSPWSANFSSMSATTCLLPKIFCQCNKFFYLKSISSFPTSVSPKIFQNFRYCT